MKGVKCFLKSNIRLLSGGIIAVILSLFVVNNTSAFMLGSQGEVTLWDVQAFLNSGGNYYDRYGSLQAFNNNPSNYKIDISEGSALAPAYLYQLKFRGRKAFTDNSIFVLQLRYQTNATGDALGFTQDIDFSFKNTLLNKNCLVNQEVTMDGLVSPSYQGKSAPSDVVCTYWIYHWGDIAADFYMYPRIYYPIGYNYLYVSETLPYFTVYEESGSGSGATFDGLTEAQLNGEFKTWLNTKLEQIYSVGGDQLTAINQLKALMESQSSDITEISNTVQQMQQQEQQDRENMESQQSDIQSSSDSAQSDFTNQSSSLASNISSILDAFNTPATDCLISIQTGDNGVLIMNNINLCAIPQEMKNTIHIISTIIITLAVLWVTYSILTWSINLAEGFITNGVTK